MAKKSLLGISLVAGISSLVWFTYPEAKSLFSTPGNSPSAVAQLAAPELESIAQEISVKVHVGEDRGSGILLAQDNNTYTVVTNAHVTQRGDNYRIETPDGVEHPASLLAVDGADTGNDLAVLQFNSRNSYQVASIGDSLNLSEGEAVTAAGFPYNGDRLMVTSGEISVLSDRSLQGGYQIGFTNQTVQGMSGGVLLNAQGEVIGVLGKGKVTILDSAYLYQDGTAPSAESTESMQQASFAIPIAQVVEVAPQLASLIEGTSPEVAQIPQPEYTGIVKTVDDLAAQITVRIATPNNPSHGSGVLVAKEENRYYVATVAHNFPADISSYEIVTPDGASYKLDRQAIEKSEAYDLAIFSFESDQDYRVATIGDYVVGSNFEQVVFVSGFPKLGDTSPPPQMITGGWVVPEDLKDFSTKDAYSLQSNGGGLLYTNISYGGMSGGAVLDRQGRLVGIHTGTEGEYFVDEEGNFDNLFIGYSLGVPIKDVIAFLQTGQSALSTQWLERETNPAAEVSDSDWQQIKSQMLTTTKPDTNADLVMWMNYGNRQWRYRNYDEAIAAFEKVLAKDPDFDRAYYATGLVHRAKEDYQAAVGAFAKATEINSNPDYYWRNLGYSYREIEQFDSALAAYDQALANKSGQNARDFVLYVEKGDVLSLLERYQEAIASYNQAIEQNPQHSWAYNNRGVAYDRLKESENALADFTKALEINPYDYAAYFNRANIYKDLQQFEDAIAQYTKAIEINPKYADAYYNRGFVYQNLQQFESAIADYTQAIEINPESVRAYNNRGVIYTDLGQYEQAITDLKKAINLAPQLTAEPYNNLGLVYKNLEEYEQAISNYTQAIEIDPQLFGAYFNRATVYSLAQEYESAIADANRVLEIEPNLVEAYCLRGLVYFYLGQHEQALADYAQAIEINPNYADAYLDRGIIYLSLEQINQAQQDLKKAASLYQEQGNEQKYQKALQLLQEINSAAS